MQWQWFFLLGIMALGSCTDLEDEDRITILEYLDTRNLIATDTSDVYVVINKSGDSTRPSESASVVFSYKGYYTDGTIFDQTSTNITLKLSLALEGLKFGLGKFGKNSEGTILIPSHRGYGSNPPFGIRKNAILIYDVKVVDFY